MALNGWQRIWVIASVLLALSALSLGVLLWPDDVLDNERIYERMPTASVSRLDWFARFAPKQSQQEPPGWSLVQSSREQRQVKTDDGAIHVFPRDATDAEITTALNPESKPLRIVATTPANIVVEGHTLQFAEIEIARPESRYDPNAVAQDFRIALHRTLAVDRVKFASKIFAAWLVLVTLLYASGWSIGWVRRGFGTRAGGLP